MKGVAVVKLSIIVILSEIPFSIPKMRIRLNFMIAHSCSTFATHHFFSIESCSDEHSDCARATVHTYQINANTYYICKSSEL